MKTSLQRQILAVLSLVFVATSLAGCVVVEPRHAHYYAPYRY